MKKLFAFLLCLTLACSALTMVACDNQQPEEGEKQKVVIAVPDGAPALAIYQLMKEVTELDDHPVEYKILAGAANIGTSIVSGEADVAVMPTNVAAKLYNNNTDVKLLSVNIFGVLYMVGKTKLTNGVNDLLGKVVLNIGRGGSPDITLKLILDKNKIPYEESETAIEGKVALRYVTDASEVIALLKTDKADYGVMGEPAVSNAVRAIPAVNVLDLQQAWAGVIEEGSYTQAGVVLSSKVYNDKGFVDALYAKLESNLSFIYDDVANVKQTLIDNGSNLKVDFNSGILDRCNLGNQKASEIKAKIETYFNAVKEYDATFIGGKLPDEGFYYVG